MRKLIIPEHDIHEIIELALNDKVPFQTIYDRFNLDQGSLKLIMKASIKKKSYINWRQRIKNKSRKNRFYKLIT